MEMNWANVKLSLLNAFNLSSMNKLEKWNEILQDYINKLLRFNICISTDYNLNSEKSDSEWNKYLDWESTNSSAVRGDATDVADVIVRVVDARIRLQWLRGGSIFVLLPLRVNHVIAETAY